MPRISATFIDRLLDNADFAGYVTSHVKGVKRSGTNNLLVTCPFHDDHTPSMSVSPHKQLYHCFGCGASGGFTQFVMGIHGDDYVAAIERIAAYAGVAVEYETTHQPAAPAAVVEYQILARVQRWYVQQLYQHPNKQQAIDYATSRGIDGTTAKTFGLGYAPANSQGLLTELVQTTATETLLTLGVAKQSDRQGDIYPAMRDRLMFPIYDRKQRVVGFGGRALANQQPKYINSTDSIIFSKGRIIYGLSLLPARTQRLIVVEGYMDVLALHQQQIPGAVACMGTAVTNQQAKLLIGNAPQLVFCFDGDAAGRQAAWRAMQAVLLHLGNGHDCRFAFLPEGVDPDEHIRSNGRAAFENVLSNALQLSEFISQSLTLAHNCNTVEGKNTFSDAAANLTGHIPQGSYRTLLIEYLATQAQINPAILHTKSELVDNNQATDALNKNVNSNTTHTTEFTSTTQPAAPITHWATALQTPIWHVLFYPHLAASLPAYLVEIAEQLHDRRLNTIFAYIQRVRDNPTIQPSIVLSELNDQSFVKVVTALAQKDILEPSTATFIQALQQTIYWLLQSTKKNATDEKSCRQYLTILQTLQNHKEPIVAATSANEQSRSA